MINIIVRNYSFNGYSFILSFLLLLLFFFASSSPSRLSLLFLPLFIVVFLPFSFSLSFFFLFFFFLRQGLFRIFLVLLQFISKRTTERKKKRISSIYSFCFLNFSSLAVEDSTQGRCRPLSLLFFRKALRTEHKEKGKIFCA